MVDYKRLLPAIAALFLVSSAGEVIAQTRRAPCQRGVYSAQPETDLREISALGMKFEIPKNYRAELQSNQVLVLDPDEYQFHQCLRRNRLGAGIDAISIVKTDAVVKSYDWPYNIPGYEWMVNGRSGNNPVPAFRYTTGLSGQDVALIVWHSDLYGVMLSTFTNIRNGGSIHVFGAEKFNDTVVTISATMQED